jgi:putative transposase
MILTYRYRIKDRTARKALCQQAVAANQVWNYCVAYQRDIQRRYLAGGPSRRWPTTFDLHNLTSSTSVELGIPAETINEVCRVFVNARNSLRKYPRFRSSFGTRRSLGWIPFKVKTRRVQGNQVRFNKRDYRFWEGGRPVPASAKGGCFVEDARGRWYICFQVEVAEAAPATRAEIGIDLGLKSLAACSDGTLIRAERVYRRHETALGIAQRSHNKRRVRAIHAKIANLRRDFLHKTSIVIARENSLIVVGNVSAAQLQQTKMAKSVSDAGWSMFRNMLRYKASRHGARYIEADERFTSQTCSRCGVIPRSSPKGMGALGIRRWECSACGSVHDRDVNAAINILNVGRSAPPHADGSRPRQKVDGLDNARHDHDGVVKEAAE